jgi:DNA-binding LacI/PurR family transcriptional regulator
VAKKVTLRQIARVANVSIPTVSRVLNRSTKVTPGIEKRVLEAARRLGLDTNGRERRRVVAFLLSNRPITHPFHSEVMSGAEAYCTEHDYQMLFSTLRYPLHVQLSQLPIPRLLERPGTVDGFIVAGVNTSRFIELLAQTRLPVAVYGDTLMDGAVEGVPVVRIDETGGATDETRYLQGLGHTAIAFVGNTRLPWIHRRYDAYSAAMKASGLEPLLFEFDSEDERQVGYVAAKSLLDRPERVTAIVTGNDHIAHGVYDALRDRQVKIGEEISVTGFNDTLEAIILHPTLTTVRVHSEQVGRKLAELVLAQIEGELPVPRDIVIPTRLIKRESCGPAPANVEQASARRP